MNEATLQNAHGAGKLCKGCGEIKPADAFYLNKDRGTLRARCKDCLRVQTNAWKARNRDKVKVYRARSYAKDAVRERQRAKEYAAANPAKRAANMAAWRAANAQHVKTYEKAYYEATREAQCERSREWLRRNPEAHRAQVARRRAKLKSPSPLTRDFYKVLAADLCSFCGSRTDITVDHIEPLSRGGEHHWMNLAAACRSCNSSKREHRWLSWVSS